MFKRIFTLLLCLALLGSVTVYAAENRASARPPTLSFNGKIAICGFHFTSFGDEIEATLELWCGSTRVAAWTKSGNSSVSFSEGCSASSGTTYTLKAHGTCGGVSFTSPSVTKTCP